MNKPTNSLLLLILILCVVTVFGQTKEATSKPPADLFLSEEVLPVKLNYSNKELKKTTNDSTFIATEIQYKNSNDTWVTMPVRIRKRGNNRLKNCYYAPVKIKIKKKDAKETLFNGNKNLKLVLPCLLQKDNNDNVIKEYMAYKLYELISPYHFKTRLLDVSYQEDRGKKVKEHQLKGFFIEDDKNVAKRFDGKVYDRDVHPLQQDDLNSVRHAMFQYMIGNVDFSQMYGHNVKLFFIDKKMIPVPYDFDMSGLANCSYGVTDASLNLSGVTDRKYRGFKRNATYFSQVRFEFLDKRPQLLAVFDQNEGYFENPVEYQTARTYVMDFFAILADEDKFNKQIVNTARTNE